MSQLAPESSAPSPTPVDIAAWRDTIRTTTFANYHYEMGRAMRQAGETGPAESALWRALEIRPDYPAAAIELDTLLTAQGRTADAAAVRAQASLRDPAYRAHGHLERAQEAIHAEELALASLELDAWITHADGAPDHLEQRLSGISLLLRLGRRTEAQTLLDRTDLGLLSEGERQTQAKDLGDWGFRLGRSGYWRSGAAILDLALLLDGRDAATHAFRGQCALVTGDLEEAAVIFARACALDPTTFWYHSYRGYALQGLGRLDEAAAEYAAARSLCSGDPITDANHALIELARGNIGLAIDVFEREAASSLSGHPLPHLHKGLALLKAGRIQEAHASLLRAYGLDPRPIGITLVLSYLPWAWDELIGVYEELGIAIPHFPEGR